jgi:hypothetical protein
MVKEPVFLRSTNRKKDGKDHRYFSVVETQRVSGNKTVQRTVLYLGEINDSQQAAWRKLLITHKCCEVAASDIIELQAEERRINR